MACRCGLVRSRKARRSMAKRYRCNLLATVSENGLTTWISSGEAVTIGDAKYVRVGGTLLEDGPHFFDTREDAQRAVADSVEEIGRRIIAQAERFRSKAEVV